MPKVGNLLLLSVLAVVVAFAFAPVSTVQSESTLPELDQAVSTSSPMAGPACFKICRSPGGTWVCDPWPVEDLCVVGPGNTCTMVDECYICNYPCD